MPHPQKAARSPVHAKKALKILTSNWRPPVASALKDKPVKTESCSLANQSNKKPYNAQPFELKSVLLTHFERWSGFRHYKTKVPQSQATEPFGGLETSVFARVLASSPRQDLLSRAILPRLMMLRLKFNPTSEQFEMVSQNGTKYEAVGKPFYILLSQDSVKTFHKTRTRQFLNEASINSKEWTARNTIDNFLSYIEQELRNEVVNSIESDSRETPSVLGTGFDAASELGNFVNEPELLARIRDGKLSTETLVAIWRYKKYMNQ